MIGNGWVRVAGEGDDWPKPWRFNLVHFKFLAGDGKNVTRVAKPQRGFAMIFCRPTRSVAGESGVVGGAVAGQEESNPCLYGGPNAVPFGRSKSTGNELLGVLTTASGFCHP